MVCVGIDVAKDKHDCCILDSDGTIRADCFTNSLPSMRHQTSESDIFPGRQSQPGEKKL